MFKTKILYLLALFFSVISFSVAQEDIKQPDFKVSFSQDNPKIGNVIEMIFKAEIPPGFHMYSTYNKCDIGPLKFNIQFVKNKSFSLVGQAYSIGDKRVIDEVFECEIGAFYKQAEVRQKIKILQPDVKISGNIEGQWCTEGTCYNFDMPVPLTFKASLKAEKGVSAPAKKSSAKQGAKKTKSLTHMTSLFLKPND